MSRPAIDFAPSLAVDLETLRFDDRGLIPVVVQDAVAGAVLMVAWANRDALKATLETGLAHFWSRSRGELWQKGETSGNVLRVVDLRPDCDRDTLLLRAHPAGPTCHTGSRTCFEGNPVALELGWLWEVLRQRSTASPEESYTARLRQRGLPRIAQKVGEEATETIIAALTGTQESRGDLVGEACDLLYHLTLLLEERGVTPEDLAGELRRRHRDRTTSPGETS